MAEMGSLFQLKVYLRAASNTVSSCQNPISADQYTSTVVAAKVLQRPLVGVLAREAHIISSNNEGVMPGQSRAGYKSEEQQRQHSDCTCLYVNKKCILTEMETAIYSKQYQCDRQTCDNVMNDINI